VQAAKLIAPKIEEKFVDGFDYVIEQVSSTPYMTQYIYQLVLESQLPHIKVNFMF